MIQFCLRILSANVKGLQSNYQKRRDSFTWLKSKKYQISIYRLQETHSTTQDEAIWCAEWGYECIFSHGTANSAGVAVLINNNFDFTITDQEKDGGR